MMAAMVPDPIESSSIRTGAVRAAVFGEWEELFAGAGRSPLEQSWHYGDAVAALHGARAGRHIVDLDGRPVALVQAFRSWDWRLGSINRIVRGPVWLEDLSADQRTDVLGAVKQAAAPRVTDLLFWLPDLPDGAASEALMKGLGLRRMVTGYATVWLDIRPAEDLLRAGLNGNWRNALVAAEKAGVRIRPANAERTFEVAVTAYDAFRKRHRYIGPPGDVIREIHRLSGGSKKESAARVWIALTGNVAIAGIAMIRHGASATYAAAWTGDEGRRLNAHNLLLWRAVGDLRKSGTQWLDLGGIDTQTSPGIARFKLGLGGEVVIQSGTYF
ncbi:MAG: GNAT family N-acetyltransferase [Alphaproteobacteria bacterium]|nr:GNAT family N-acetyltransferase [Alphaproteobacteria bacterium]